MVVAALRKCLRPSIGPSRSLIDRWSCSIKLFDVFGGPNLALISLGMFAEKLCRPAMRHLIAVERDLVWQLALALERPSEERLGGGDVPLGAKKKIDGVALFVDSAV